MFQFMSIKAYKKTFLSYMLILLLLFITISSLLYTYFLNIAFNAYTEKVSFAAYDVNQYMDRIVYRIDNFLSRLYSDSALWDDFYLFFTCSSPSEYTAKRIEHWRPDYSVSFLDSATAFVRESGYSISNIIYYSSTHIINMKYSPNGQIRYIITDTDPLEAMPASGCYVYSRELKDKRASYIGKVSFLINPLDKSKESFRDIPSAHYIRINDMVLNLSDHPYGELFKEKIISSDYTGKRTQGHLRLSNFRSVYYILNTSEKYGFTIFSFIPRAEIMEAANYRFTVQVILLLLLLTFFFAIYILASRFSNNYRLLCKIIGLINDAKKGKFTQIDSFANDELSLIVQHLNEMSTQLNSYIQKEYLLQIENFKAEMKALESQINPHFLYNTLERIRAYALGSGVSNVADAVGNLGRLYRVIVKSNTFLSIDEELKIGIDYLDLMCFLYGDDLMYHVDVSESCRQLKTIKIWMQPILENFFKHNFTGKEEYKIIIISGEEREDGYYFDFSSNIGHLDKESIEHLNSLFTPSKLLHEADEKNSEARSGIGLKNVYARLYYYYEGRVSMSIGNNDPSGIIISVVIYK
ncbi:hypothetical protein CDQ84_10675 [Clostridium thermosuccinogenes]|uniref:Signal transduction histidine kinase internal region domain-containing protein n=1 Tax=Clostridium thermosuccinogenes TaxID=84032 RepID=A0A2K2FII2_9CLOT|nr:histidine kinase [Pseudoclostridium thermosuccinogenes]AUS95199.1 hypothetical protein CDO33_01285 [Pseudoclostridium thermosuccinogenes]PNT96757.1 hypothetical protein CDQ85_10520 [Pseudoclostridium thermosuccinogenes]PNT98594.1 hypothetical protein CDQ84_10675 [Pseudoclostridium thermosuccinogenes]